MIQKPQPSGERTRGQVLALGVIWCASLALVTISSGCSYTSSTLSALSLNDWGCCCCEDLDTRIAARRAWKQGYAHCYRNHCARRDVRDGFVYGYVKACTGGDTCPPLFAPESNCMIGGRDRNAAAWFQGFPLGVIAAEKRGCVPAKLVNPEYYGCNANQGCNPGCEPCQPCGAQLGNAPMMMAPEYSHGEQWTEPAPIYDEHQQPHIDPVQENIEGTEPTEQVVPEPEVDSGLEDETAASTTDLVPTQELAEVVDEQVEDDGQAVRLALPIDWDAVEQAERDVTPVKFEDR